MTAQTLESRRAVIDTLGMHAALCSFPSQARVGLDYGARADLGEIPMDDIASVVICGMGGSAFGGDILRVLALSRARVPVAVLRGYALPAYAGPRTLIITMSYSGNTEETLSAYDDARSRGSRIVAVTTGGELAQRAQRDGTACVLIPGGYAPRAALGYLYFALHAVCERLGVIPRDPAAVEEALSVLDFWTNALADPSSSGNRAVEIARQLHGRLPVIYANVETLDCVPVRWRCQIEENAKALAYSNVLPEMNHNEIVGWESDGDVQRSVAVIALHDREDSARIALRYRVTLDTIRARAGAVIDIPADQESQLARLFFLIVLGDWVSYWLAIINGIDPTPIASINALKAALAGA